MDFLTENNFELKLNLKREDIFENDVLSYSLYVNEEFEILFIVETGLNYNEDSYFNSSIYNLSNGLHNRFGLGNCFFILNSFNHFYLIPFLNECPQSNKLYEFEIIENKFEISKKNTILRRINNELNNLKSVHSDLIYNTNRITKHFYNSWLKYGDLKKFNYGERIQIQLPRYIYDNLEFNINILEPEEIASPDKESEGYKYLQTCLYFNDYIKNRDEIIEVFSVFCKKHNLNFNIKNDKIFYD